MPVRDFVFLSPHRDDACFSLGLLARMTGGTLVNLFTRSQYTLATVDEFSPATIAEVSAIRHAEDRGFITMCNLHEIDLQWSEAPLRGYRPFDGDDLDTEIDSFAPQLHRALGALNQSSFLPKAWLFCPMGIGGHRDHLIVRNALLRDLGELERRFSVAFYEELPYASDPGRRESGIGDFFRALAATGKSGLRRQTLRLGRRADLKLRMVCLYASQFEASPTTLAQYIPAVAGAEPHEAVWARGRLSRDARLWLLRLAHMFRAGVDAPASRDRPHRGGA